MKSTHVDQRVSRVSDEEAKAKLGEEVDILTIEVNEAENEFEAELDVLEAEINAEEAQLAEEQAQLDAEETKFAKEQAKIVARKQKREERFEKLQILAAPILERKLASITEKVFVDRTVAAMKEKVLLALKAYKNETLFLSKEVRQNIKTLRNEIRSESTKTLKDIQILLSGSLSLVQDNKINTGIHRIFSQRSDRYTDLLTTFLSEIDRSKANPRKKYK